MAYEKIREHQVKEIAELALKLSAGLRAPHERIPDITEVYAALSFFGSGNGGWTRVGLVPVKDDSEVLHIGNEWYVNNENLVSAITRKSKNANLDGVLCRQVRLNSTGNFFHTFVFVQNTSMLKGERVTMTGISF